MKSTNMNVSRKIGSYSERYLKQVRNQRSTPSFDKPPQQSFSGGDPGVLSCNISKLPQGENSPERNQGLTGSCSTPMSKNYHEVQLTKTRSDQVDHIPKELHADPSVEEVEILHFNNADIENFSEHSSDDTKSDNEDMNEINCEYFNTPLHPAQKGRYKWDGGSSHWILEAKPSSRNLSQESCEADDDQRMPEVGVPAVVCLNETMNEFKGIIVIDNNSDKYYRAFKICGEGFVNQLYVRTPEEGCIPPGGQVEIEVRSSTKHISSCLARGDRLIFTSYPVKKHLDENEVKDFLKHMQLQWDEDDAERIIHLVVLEAGETCILDGISLQELTPELESRLETLKKLRFKNAHAIALGHSVQNCTNAISRMQMEIRKLSNSVDDISLMWTYGLLLAILIFTANLICFVSQPTHPIERRQLDQETKESRFFSQVPYAIMYWLVNLVSAA